MTTHRRILIGFAAVGLALLFGAHLPLWKVLIALGACYGMFRFGIGMIGSMAQPIPPPPPAGELRKVRMNYRCTLCGTEVRMTVANDETPEPPRHCLEDMEFVAPVME